MKSTDSLIHSIDVTEAETIDGGSVRDAWKLFNCVSAMLVDAVTGHSSADGACG